MKPPRSAVVRFPFGSPVGRPGDAGQQLAVLTLALGMLVTAAEPGAITDLEHEWRPG